MKHLCYLRPSDAFAQAVLNFPGADVSKVGVHCTLASFSMERDEESALEEALHSIPFRPFTVVTRHFDTFDDDALVVRVSHAPALLQLHNDIVTAVRAHATPGFSAQGERYIGAQYNPHITVGKASRAMPTEMNALLGKLLYVQKYHFARKTERGWERIASFGARERVAYK
jgi:2'-5' RNA ligase